MSDTNKLSRRTVVVSGAAAAAVVVTAPLLAAACQATQTTQGDSTMGTVKASDGVEIFYKTWGAGQPIVFHHGWPLSGDDWDGQMMFFAEQGYRVVAHDRRGHGRSSPSASGNDMDTYAADVAAVAKYLDLKDAIHVGHSTGGGEVARYVARHGGGGRVAKAVLIGAIPPALMKSASNPGGVPPEVIAGIRTGVATNRAQFYRDFASGPFYGYNRPGVTASQAVVDNWFRQAMNGDIKAQYDCITAFAETDFTADLKAIEQPVLVMHGEDDQIVPLGNNARRTAEMLKRGTLKTYPGLSHGMATVNAATINADILAFVRS